VNKAIVYPEYCLDGSGKGDHPILHIIINVELVKFENHTYQEVHVQFRRRELRVKELQKQKGKREIIDSN